MKKERYEEIKEIETNLKGIARIKYLLELGDKERTEYFEHKRFIQFQKEWIGIY